MRGGTLPTQRTCHVPGSSRARQLCQRSTTRGRIIAAHRHAHEQQLAGIASAMRNGVIADVSLTLALVSPKVLCPSPYFDPNAPIPQQALHMLNQDVKRGPELSWAEY